MSYVERNMLKEEKIVARAYVTGLAFIPILIKAAIIIALGMVPMELPGLLLTVQEKLNEKTSLMSYVNDPFFKFIQILSTVTYVLFVLVAIFAVGYAIICISRLWSIELVVTDKKLMGKSGALFYNSMDICLEKIDSITIDVSPLGNLFHYANITVGCASGTLRFDYISNAVRFKSIVMKCYDAKMESLMKQQAAYVYEMFTPAEERDEAEDEEADAAGETEETPDKSRKLPAKTEDDRPWPPFSTTAEKAVIR